MPPACCLLYTCDANARPRVRTSSPEKPSPPFCGECMVKANTYYMCIHIRIGRMHMYNSLLQQTRRTYAADNAYSAFQATPPLWRPLGSFCVSDLLGSLLLPIAGGAAQSPSLPLPPPLRIAPLLLRRVTRHETRGLPHTEEYFSRVIAR